MSTQTDGRRAEDGLNVGAVDFETADFVETIIMRLANRLRVVEGRLRAVAHGDDGIDASEADALQDILEEVRGALRDDIVEPLYHESKPTDGARLVEVLGVCQAAIGLAADGELENSYGVPPRAVFREVCDYLIPAWDDALQARELDEEEECTVAGNTLEALAGEAKMRRTVRYGQDVEMEDGELYRIEKVGPGKELAPGVYATTRDGGHRMGTLIEVDESVDRNEFSDYLHAESEKHKRAIRQRVRDQMDRS